MAKSEAMGLTSGSGRKRPATVGEPPSWRCLSVNNRNLRLGPMLPTEVTGGNFNLGASADERRLIDPIGLIGPIRPISPSRCVRPSAESSKNSLTVQIRRP
jgi:hypothetical protein